MTDDASEIERLWGEYKRDGDRAVRDKLIVHYSPLVKYVAGRVAVGLPQNVEQSDLVVTVRSVDPVHPVIYREAEDVFVPYLRDAMNERGGPVPGLSPAS